MGSMVVMSRSPEAWVSGSSSGLSFRPEGCQARESESVRRYNKYKVFDKYIGKVWFRGEASYSKTVPWAGLVAR